MELLLMYLMSTSCQSKIYSLFSLSKTLGLCGSSLLFCNNEKLNFSGIKEENIKEIIRPQQFKVN